MCFMYENSLLFLSLYKVLQRLDHLDAYLCSKVHGSRIGLAKIKQGLYYLPGLDSRSPVAGGLKVASVQASTTLVEPIMNFITKWVTLLSISSNKCIRVCLRTLKLSFLPVMSVN